MQTSGGARWRSASLTMTGCMALAEIVNLPEQFTSQNPHYVVQHTHWIVWSVPVWGSSLVKWG